MRAEAEADASEEEAGGSEAGSDDEEKKKKEKPKKKKKGGVQIPEHWPWEEAKKVFMQPDVLPDDHEDCQVRSVLSLREWINSLTPG